MAFNRNFITAQSSSLTHVNVPMMWVYDGSGATVNDTVATIKGSAYFNSMRPTFTLGGFLYILGTDTADLVRVTAITPNVTVTSVIGTLPPGSVEKVDLSSGITYNFMARWGLINQTTVGGAAQEVFNIAGVIIGDVAIAQITDPAGTAISVLGTKVTGADTVTITFSADPGVIHDVSILVFRPST